MVIWKCTLKYLLKWWMISDPWIFSVLERLTTIICTAVRVWELPSLPFSSEKMAIGWLVSLMKYSKLKEIFLYWIECIHSEVSNRFNITAVKSHLTFFWNNLLVYLRNLQLSCDIQTDSKPQQRIAYQL